MYLPENLKVLRAQNGMTQQQLSNELELKRSTYKDYESGINEPSIAVLVRLSTFYKISLDKLINTDLNSLSEEEENTGLRILAITVNEDESENIELVPVKAQAGYMQGYSDPLYLDTLSRFRLPNLPTGTFRAFEIEGDSMPPVDNKSIVIGRYVEYRRDIKNLSTYVFITKSGIVYKRVINKVKQKGIFIMLSDNAYYEPYYLPAEEVIEVWAYYAHFSFGYDGPDYVSQMMKLEDLGEVENLKQIIQERIGEVLA